MTTVQTDRQREVHRRKHRVTTVAPVYPEVPTVAHVSIIVQENERHMRGSISRRV